MIMFIDPRIIKVLSLLGNSGFENVDKFLSMLA